MTGRERTSVAATDRPIGDSGHEVSALTEAEIRIEEGPGE
jgi:hypothetical protein